MDLSLGVDLPGPEADIRNRPTGERQGGDRDGVELGYAEDPPGNDEAA
jgi:hypothetical protein